MTQPSTDSRTPGGMPTRRRVLGVTAALGAGGLLAACGGGETAPEATGAPETPTASEGTTAATGAALVAVADVPVGDGVILEEAKVVVTQPTAGTFKAFTAVCTHQGCTVASIKNGVIGCPCHGSAFNAADGSVKNGPATRPLKEIPVAVEGDQVVRS